MNGNLLVCGGAGFIGSNFINKFIDKVGCDIINYDALTYAGNLNNLVKVENNKNYHFVKGDIKDKKHLLEVCKKYNIKGIINFAAESHVDRSIQDATPFIDTNIKGTLALLEVVRELSIERYLQVSTDEVYGSLGDTGYFTESTPISPNSPYSASKASSDMLVQAFYHTYNLPVVITRCSNNYGPFHFPEKLIPLMILNALEDKSLPVYGNGMNVRDWIYVDDHNEGIWKVFQKGRIGEVYNLGGNSERTNIDVVKGILSILNKPLDLINYVKDRPGHDKRYAIDFTKIKNELGWTPKVKFEEGLESTVEWYLNNKEWYSAVRDNSYLEYYMKQYGE